MLIDTAVFIDLVLHFQRSSRIRSVASSAGAAIESLIIYDAVCIDPSFAGLVEHSTSTRYLDYYCDDIKRAVGQLSDIASLTSSLPLESSDVASVYAQCLEQLREYLSKIENPDEIDAYQLYDFLPYHLGEDSTAIECHIGEPSVADLEEIIGDFPVEVNNVLCEFGVILRERNHPTRAVWVLALLRLLYYQRVQQLFGLHYVPHLTKSTIAFGRSDETKKSRRLIDYCNEDAQRDFHARWIRLFGSRVVCLPIPDFSVLISRSNGRWESLMDAIVQVRNSDEAYRYRAAVSKVLSSLSSEKESSTDELLELEAAEVDWRKRTLKGVTTRYITITPPFFRSSRKAGISGLASAVQPAATSMMLMHELLPGC